MRCPCCGGSFSEFVPDAGVPNVVCLRCGSHSRHRALWLFLDAHPELLDGVRDVLHFAPEYAIGARLSRLPGYVSADIADEDAMVRADITALPFADASFDAFLCSHVLEHVPDDAAAMRELVRVLRPGGFGIVMVPFEPGRSRTHEDPSLADPAAREREFGQHDHVRLYGEDLDDRLAAAGFAVARESAPEQADPELRVRYGLSELTDYIWLCRPAAAP